MTKVGIRLEGRASSSASLIKFCSRVLHLPFQQKYIEKEGDGKKKQRQRPRPEKIEG